MLLGGFVLGLLILALAVLPLVRRLPALRRALAGLARRAAQAEAMQAGAEELNERLMALAEQAERLQESRRSRSSERSEPATPRVAQRIPSGRPGPSQLTKAP
jgi:uncharacterized membrane protein YccC